MSRGGLQLGRGFMSRMVSGFLGLLFMGILLYYVFNNPGQAADTTRTVVSTLSQWFHAGADFLQRVFQHSGSGGGGNSGSRALGARLGGF